MDRDLATRRVSASIFGNEKIAEIVLLLEAEPGALLPKVGNARGPAYYEKNAESPLWQALVNLAQVITSSETSDWAGSDQPSSQASDP